MDVHMDVSVSLCVVMRVFMNGCMLCGGVNELTNVMNVYLDVDRYQLI